jgi:RNA recognition motif-containing protein
MSKHHKNSKRKDLAFITFDSIDEAKHALEAFRQNNPISPNVSVSMAFSQQAMQTKKKIKEGRNRSTSPSHTVTPPVNTPILNNNIQTATMLTMMNLFNMNKVIY